MRWLSGARNICSRGCLIHIVSVFSVYLYISTRLWEQSKQCQIHVTDNVHIENVTKNTAKTPTRELTKQIQPSSNYTLSQSDVDEIAQRKLLVSQFCRTSHNTAIPSKNLKRQLVDQKHKVVYCTTPKTGTTSWFLMFAYLTGKVKIKLTNQDENSFQAWKDDQQRKIGLNVLSRFPRDKVQDILTSSFKFMFARNPYERLVSTYEDKFRNTSNREYYHNKYGKFIVKRFRPNHTNENDTFSKYSKKVSIMPVLGNDVTFPEFIKFVIYSFTKQNVIKGLPDEHWDRITDMCNLCQINYDFIGKMDTISHDADIVLHKGFKLKDPPHFPENKEGHKTDYDRIREHFRNIPLDDIERIKQIYKVDFEIFGYSQDLQGL